MPTIIVHAGSHDRREVPCEVPVDLPDGYFLVKDESGNLYPAQVADGRLSFVIPFMREGETKRLKIVDGEPEPLLKIEDTGSEARVVRGSQLIASYRYLGGRMPYVYPLSTWTGYCVTEDSPRDHPHHHSLWTAHGDVNGADFWAGEGVIKHIQFLRLTPGPVYAEIVSECSWVAEGRALLSEIRGIRFWNLPSKELLLDYVVTLSPAEGKVVLGDTKEAGIVSLRVTPSITVERGGRLTNSWGGVNEREVWGRRAVWCDYSGPLGDGVYGIAVFDHPLNPRHPTYWHARDYGLMTANVFGLSHFVGGRRGDMVLEKATAFKFRLFVHRGWAGEANVAGGYLNFSCPPEIEYRE